MGPRLGLRAAARAPAGQGGGVHCRFDITAGEELGIAGGERVMARVQRDGAGT